MNEIKIAFMNGITCGVVIFVAGISSCHANASGQALTATVSVIDPGSRCNLQVVPPASTSVSVTYTETGSNYGAVDVNNPGDGPLIEVNTGIDSPQSDDPTLEVCQLSTIDVKIQPSTPVTGPRCLPSTQSGGAGGVFYYSVGVGGVWSVNAAGTRTPIHFPLSLLKDNKPNGSPVNVTTATGVVKHFGQEYTPAVGAGDVSFVYLNNAYVGPVLGSSGNIISPVALNSCTHTSTYGVMVELTSTIPSDSQKIQIMVNGFLSDATYNTNKIGWDKEYGLVLNGENYTSLFTATTTIN